MIKKVLSVEGTGIPNRSVVSPITREYFPFNLAG
jgi:hypothetical protein